MTEFRLKITAQSPVLLGDGPPRGNLNTTLDFIPGSVLRGVMARRYLDTGGHPADEAFRSLFLEGESIFDHGTLNGCEAIPLSARTCKYEGGFRHDMAGPGAPHGVLDLTLSDRHDLQCPYPGCGQPLDYFQGIYRTAPVFGRRAYAGERVSRRLLTRTAIDNTAGVASAGQLYSQEVIEEGQVFFARWTVDREELIPVAERLVGTSFSACIGRGRSRGQGWVDFGRVENTSPEMGPAADRADLFRTPDGRPRLVVTLMSDAILSDAYLRDVSLPEISHLAAEGRLKARDWERGPAYAFSETRTLFGFDGYPLNLPAVPRLAIKAGSVFVFRAASSCPALPEGNGEIRIGDSLASGYGRAVIWHPFHLDLKPACENRDGDYTILSAKALYDAGLRPDNVSLAQIEAVGQRISRAPDFETALTRVDSFLQRGMDRLRKRVAAGEKECSWLAPCRYAGEPLALGALVNLWLADRLFLPEGERAGHPDPARRLEAFWRQVATYCRYQKNMEATVRLYEGNNDEG